MSVTYVEVFSPEKCACERYLKPTKYEKNSANSMKRHVDVLPGEWRRYIATAVLSEYLFVRLSRLSHSYLFCRNG